MRKTAFTILGTLLIAGLATQIATASERTGKSLQQAKPTTWGGRLGERSGLGTAITIVSRQSLNSLTRSDRGQ
jgi:hypothetical protein